MGILVAADTGGTFTDFVTFDSQRKQFASAKSLTTYDDLMRGVMECLAKTPVSLDDADSFKFGTTLVINTYLQRSGARVAFITTRGFRDVLEIRRGNRPVPFDLAYERDAALVPRDRRYEIAERIDSRGSVVVPLDIAELENLALRLASLKIDAVAICFLNAYVSDTHEKFAGERLRSLLPDVYVTTGSELTREWHEYERASTVAASAYVGPLLNSFLANMTGNLEGVGFSGKAYVMASNGGVIGLEELEQAACRAG